MIYLIKQCNHKTKIIISTIFLICISILKVISQDYNAEVLNKQTIIEIEANCIVKKIKIEIKINNRNGEKYTEIQIPYSKISKISKIEGYIKDNNENTIRRLKNKEIKIRSEISDFSFYEDDLIKEFSLKFNVYPYIISYSYEISEKEFLTIEDWSPVLDLEIPTKAAELQINAPKDYSINFKSQKIQSPKIDTLENKINYKWTANYYNIINNIDDFAPPLNNELPEVIVVPENFKFISKGSFSNWVEYGNWNFNLIKGLNELTENEKNKIKNLIKNANGDLEKIKILYEYLQSETHYLNIRIDKGGFEPYPATYVIKNKYGDCKTLTNYMKSILDYVGIKSYYTLINAGEPKTNIDKNFPSQQFNHAILYVPGFYKDLWIDCTSDNSLGYVGTFIQNRDAFVIDENNSRFIKTPALSINDVKEERNIFIYNKTNNTQIEYKNKYKGETYEDIIILKKQISNNEMDKIIHKHFVDKETQILNYQIVDIKDSNIVNIFINGRVEYNDYKSVQEFIFKPIKFELPTLQKPKIRKLPVQIDFPINKKDYIYFTIPEAFEIELIPSNYYISNTAGNAECKITRLEHALIISKSIEIYPKDINPEDYQDYYYGYNELTEAENTINIILKRK